MVGLTLFTGRLLTRSPSGDSVRILTIIFNISGWLVFLCIHEHGHAIAGYLGGGEGVAYRGTLTLDSAVYTNPVFSFLLPILFLVMGWHSPVRRRNTALAGLGLILVGTLVLNLLPVLYWTASISLRTGWSRKSGTQHTDSGMPQCFYSSQPSGLYRPFNNTFWTFCNKLANSFGIPPYDDWLGLSTLQLWN